MSLPLFYRIVFCSVTAASLAGCAGVTFYSSPDLKGKTGIPVYGSSPYLLVARTGKADKPVETSIIYITDPNQVIFAKPRSGFGSANLTLALSGGQLTSFGQQTDTKLPELVSSLAGIVTARATADKLVAEGEAIRAGIGTQQSAVLATATSDGIRALALDMSNQLSEARFANELLPSEKAAVDAAQTTLTAIANSLANPGNRLFAPQEYAKLKAAGETLAKAIKAPDGTSTPRNSSLQRVQAWVEKIEAIHREATKVTPASPEPPPFELYKIVFTAAGDVELHPVVASPR